MKYLYTKTTIFAFIICLIAFSITKDFEAFKLNIIILIILTPIVLIIDNHVRPKLVDEVKE